MTASDAISFRHEPEPAADVPVDVPVEAPIDGPVQVDYDNPAHAKWTPPMRLLALPARRETTADRFVWPLIALVVAALYLCAILSYWAPAHPGTDQNGYFVGARQYAHTLSSGLKPESDYGFIGRMWVMADSGVNYPKYPLGLPMIYAACLRVFGDAKGVEYAHMVSPICAALASLGVFAITRRISGGFVGIMAQLLMACGQVMLTLSINPNSHASCTCAVVWGIYFLIRWLETGAIWRGILAGGLFGAAYTIRYTEGLLLLPIGVALLYSAQWRVPGIKRAAITFGSAIGFAIVALLVAYFGGTKLVAKYPWLGPLGEDNGRMYSLLVAAIALEAMVTTFISPRSLIRWLAVQLAWLLPVVYLTGFNLVAMHAFTSYAGTNESTGFDLDYFSANWEKMIRVMNDQGLFFVAPLGVLGLVCMFRRLPLVATLLTLWFVPSVLLYTAYYWAPDNMGVSYSRFILTELPALVIAAAWLMGEVTRRMNTGGVLTTGGGRGANITTILLGVAASLLAIALILTGAIGFRAQGSFDEGYWWALVPTGLILLVVGAGAIASRMRTDWRTLYTRHFSGSVPRLGIAAVVFISCSLGAWRTVLGSEWGQRIMVRANVEIAARQNANLAGLGDEVRRAIDGPVKEKNTRAIKDYSDVILFSEGERLNHLQWIGGWQLFDTGSFSFDRATRGLYRPVEENDPDPIDPSRTKFLQGLYKGADQRSLQAEQNKLIGNALDSGKRVYYVLSDNAAKTFGRQIDRRQFDVKENVGSYNDMPSPRLEDDFLTAADRPKQPINRFGRGNAFAGPNFLGNEKMSYKIGQIVKKPATTMPTTAPSTKPTTQP